MKSKFFLLISILFTTEIYSQDNDALAKTYYINAEEYFNRGSLGGYDSCVAELEKAEKALGTTNPKILYLKIRAMSQSVLPYHDQYYVYDLDKSIKKFFQITDSKNYPGDKYSEIVNLNDRFRSAFNSYILEDSTYRNSDSALYLRGDFYKTQNDLFKKKGVLQFAELYFTESAIINENAKAMSALGSLYSEKVIERVREDRNNFGQYDVVQAASKAEYWYNQAGEKGDFQAWSELGSMFYIYLEDYKKAFKYLSLASEKNDGDGSYYLGEMYYNGRGVSQDYKKAMENYIKVTKAPRSTGSYYRDAVLQIYLMYQQGKGVKRDKKIAQEWLGKAKD